MKIGNTRPWVRNLKSQVASGVREYGLKQAGNNRIAEKGENIRNSEMKTSIILEGILDLMREEKIITGASLKLSEK